MLFFIYYFNCISFAIRLSGRKVAIELMIKLMTPCCRRSGLRFLRIIYLLNTPELLQLLHVLKSSSRIRVAKALTVVLSVWMLGASMYFLVSDVTFPRRRRRRRRRCRVDSQILSYNVGQVTA